MTAEGDRLGLVAAIKAFQDAVDRFDAAAATRLGVNETDLRCLTHLADVGAARPSELAKVLGLTRGSMTASLNRLERDGRIERSTNVADGRSHFVRLAAGADEQVRSIWALVYDGGREHLASYSEAELSLLATFMRRSVRLHDDCTERLLALPLEAGPGVPRRGLPDPDA